MNLKNISIKNKLTAMILIITTIAIGSGFTVVIIKDTRMFKEELINNTMMNAKLIGEYCIVPLTFEDKELDGLPIVHVGVVVGLVITKGGGKDKLWSVTSRPRVGYEKA